MAGTVNSQGATIANQGTFITNLTSTVEGHTATLGIQGGEISKLQQDLENEIAARAEADRGLQGDIQDNAENIQNNANDIGELQEALEDKVENSAFTEKVAELTNAINQKASSSSVTNLSATVSNLSTTVAGKANTTDVNNALAKKANTTDVNAALAQKADAQTVNTALAGKASTATTTSLQNQINSLKDTDIADLQERVETNETTLGTLTADENTTGSVKQQVNEAVVTLVGGAPAAMSSLQKLIEWLGGYGDNEAEQMMSNLVYLVQIHDGQIGTLNEDLSSESSQRIAGDETLDGKIVGFCRYCYEVISNDSKGFDSEIMALYVMPNLKGQGIGKKLFTYVKEDLLEHNKKQMVLWCLKDNMPSRGFYEKMGGKIIAEHGIEIGGKIYPEVGFGYDLLD